MLGSEPLLHELASTMQFWKMVLREFGNETDPVSCDEVLEDLQQVNSLAAIGLETKKGFPAIYSHSNDGEPLLTGLGLLNRTQASRKRRGWAAFWQEGKRLRIGSGTPPRAQRRETAGKRRIVSTSHRAVTHTIKLPDCDTACGEPLEWGLMKSAVGQEPYG